MPSYPLATLAPTITDAGISAPPYSDIYASLQASFQGIYGSDAYIAPDSQDGQQLAIFAKAQFDSNQAIIDSYNQRSPISASGAGLASVVKINGIKKQSASNSSAAVTIVGRVGTDIINGIVGDNANLGTKWALPSSVVIPSAGFIIVTATCTELGDNEAAENTLTTILTPTLGWQSVTNPASATAGAPIESDATLRQRQTTSTSLPALTIIESTEGSIANIPGVIRSIIYENDTDSTDAEGVPSHSISAVVQGGDVNAIAAAISLKKTPGTGTYGSTQILVSDSKGIPKYIRFYVLSVVQLDITINIKALAGYVSTTGDKIIAAVAADRSALEIGSDSYTSDIYSPANLSGDEAMIATGLAQSQLDRLKLTYKVNSITQARHGDGQSSADVPIAFNEAAAAIIANITLNVT